MAEDNEVVTEAGVQSATENDANGTQAAQLEEDILALHESLLGNSNYVIKQLYDEGNDQGGHRVMPITHVDAVLGLSGLLQNQQSALNVASNVALQLATHDIIVSADADVWTVPEDATSHTLTDEEKELFPYINVAQWHKTSIPLKAVYNKKPIISIASLERYADTAEVYDLVKELCYNELPNANQYWSNWFTDSGIKDDAPSNKYTDLYREKIKFVKVNSDASGMPTLVEEASYSLLVYATYSYIDNQPYLNLYAAQAPVAPFAITIMGAEPIV